MIYYTPFFEESAPVAQLDRASDYESEGCRFDSCQARHYGRHQIAGWSSLVARQAHNLKVVGSNPAPATNLTKGAVETRRFLFLKSAVAVGGAYGVQ